LSTVIPAAQPIIGDDERAAVDRVLASGGIAQGPEVASFEREFADQLVDGRICVATSSGTAGAHLGLLACGVGAGDEVIVPSFTFAATANAVALTGATPVFADIDSTTYCLDPSHVESMVTDRTVAIMPVHLFGHPADMAGLQGVADRTGIRVFEDAAQAHGAAIDGRPVGTFGDFAMFSLYPTKNMTTGEGGMDACADDDTAQRIRLLRNQGMKRRYENEVIGFNARMTDIHAAIGRVQLTKLEAWTKQRRETARFYDAELRGVITPHVAENVTHVYHQYTIEVDGDRDDFAATLADEHGVGTGIYYSVPTHRLPSYGLDLDLPTTAAAARRVLSLPVHPMVDDAARERVVEAVNAVAGAGS
jgi:dTDP-4-amino-4,6-dideoxygalactose transaminase